MKNRLAIPYLGLDPIVPRSSFLFVDIKMSSVPVCGWWLSSFADRDHLLDHSRVMNAWIISQAESSDGNQRPYRNGYLPSATIQTSSVNPKENFFWWLMSADCCLRPDWRQPCPADAGFGDIKLGHTRPFYGDASARDYVLTPKQSPLSLSPNNNPAIRVFWHPDNNVESFITRVRTGFIADLLRLESPLLRLAELSLCPTHMVSRVFLAFTFYDRYWPGLSKVISIFSF